MATTESGPTARHRRLAAELLRLRENAKLGQEHAAGVLRWGRTKLVRIETAKSMPTVADVKLILHAYGGTDEAIKLALVELACDIRERGWWAAYGAVLAGSYAQLEDAASRIRHWQVQLIPGLLQTEGYAREIIRIDSPPDEVERRVQARVHRKTLLARQDAPTLEVLLAEEVLGRPPGSQMMRAQAQALLEAATNPKISIRVVPLSVGHHAGTGQGPMVIFGFPSPVELDVAYLETMAGGVYVEESSQVRRCNVIFDRIADVALSEEESAALLAAIA